MFKKGLIALGAIMLLVVAFFSISTGRGSATEPDSHQPLYGKDGEVRDNGDGEYLLPVSSELR